MKGLQVPLQPQAPDPPAPVQFHWEEEGRVPGGGGRRLLQTADRTAEGWRP